MATKIVEAPRVGKNPNRYGDKPGGGSVTPGYVNERGTWTGNVRDENGNFFPEYVEYADQFKTNTFNRDQTFIPVSAPQVPIPAMLAPPPVYGPEQLAGLRAALPAAPTVRRFPLALTQVPLPEGLQQTSDLAGELISGETGIYRDLLEGDPDMASLGYLQSLTRSEYENFYAPSLATLGSANPYGEGLNSGAMVRTQQQSLNDLMTQQARERFEYQEAAKDRSLAAVQALPGLAGVQSIEYDAAVANAERAINTKFANDQNARDAYLADLQAWNLALQELQTIVNQEQFGAEYVRVQQEFATQVMEGNANRDLTAQQSNQGAFLDASALELDAYNSYQDRVLRERELEAQLQAIEDAQSGGLWGALASGVGAIGGGILGAGTDIGALGGAALGGSLLGGLGNALGGGGYGGIQSAIQSAPISAYYLSQIRGPGSGGETAAAGISQGQSLNKVNDAGLVLSNPNLMPLSYLNPALASQGNFATSPSGYGPRLGNPTE